MLSSIRRLPSAWLLVVQLAVLVTAPMLGENLFSHLISSGLSALALLMVANVIRESPIFNTVGLALVVLAIALSSLATWAGMSQLTPWANIVESAAYFYAAAGMVLYMLEDHFVSADELFAAAAVFTLLAWAFAFLYSACQFWSPKSFTAAVNSEAPRTWLELLFLSFTSLSSTGLGDIIPVSPPARVISSIQMFTGVMYMALVVSRLVGMVPRKG